MVNYHDPVVVAQDFCESTFVVKHARELVELADFFLQWHYRSSGMLWLDFTCVSALPLVPFARIAYLIIRRFISSWEFVTTLDYEWSVIRGRRPYVWTIWVRGNAVGAER
jgi:hypothetical protein